MISMLSFIFGTTAQANNLFAPAITVNDKSITHYEISQRETLLKALKAPGNPVEGARKQLIEDRLKLSVAEDLDVLPTEEEILTAMDEFSARARMERIAFLQELSRIGIDEQSFRDFIIVGIAWRMPSKVNLVHGVKCQRFSSNVPSRLQLLEEGCGYY